MARLVGVDAGEGVHARIADLARICGALNGAGARYLLIGGFALIAHGAGRSTQDINI